MKALITGGSGYFGSLLVEKLLSENWECRVLDINYFRGRNDVEFIKGDVREKKLLLKACEDIDIVFHNVAQVPLAKDKELFNSVNIDGTVSVLKACISKKVKKIIYTSSSAVFGVPKKNPVTENSIPNPQEDYGRAKYIAEKKCNEFISEGLEVIIIRPRTILGHGRLGIFQILFEWIRSGYNIPVLGNGENIYQFVHAYDLADAIILSANKNIKSGIYNCGTDRYGSMRETLEFLCKYADTGSKVKNTPFSLATMGMKISSMIGLSPLGDYHSLMYGRSMYFDIKKANQELGWKPKFSNNEMFVDSYDWYCKNREVILKSNNNGSHHQSKVREGVLNIVKRLL